MREQVLTTSVLRITTMFLKLLVAALFVTCEGQGPSWLSECVGFGCAPARDYNHNSCTVDSLTESALRSCVTGSEYTHVRFSVSGTISISSSIKTSPNLIIDGSGQSVTLTGRELFVERNTIIYRLSFDTGGNDGIAVQRNDVWVHKCSFRNYDDGLIDITNGATGVTVSYCEFRDHHKTMLIAKDPSDNPDKVTLHHNHFHDLHSRQPRIRNAHVHIFNNVYENWEYYAIASSQRGRALVENNWFQSNRNQNSNMKTKEGSDPDEGYFRSRGNRLGPGCVEINREPSQVPDAGYSYNLETADDNLYQKVIREAGNQ